MLIFANAKINIGLNILNKRNDGFHDIESVFYPIPLYDIIEFSIIDNKKTDYNFTNSGLQVDSKPADNLCIKSYLLLKKKHNLPPLNIHLHKVIPFGAGLGGGSSNAAFILKALNDFFKLDISEKNLLGSANYLGSDCSFFIKNKPALVSGKGETLIPINLNLSNYHIALIHPLINVNTKEAYENIIPDSKKKSLKELISENPENWKTEIANDFENSVFIKYPEVKQIKEKLYKSGALYASMTGSGSSVYGIFSERTELNNEFPGSYFVWYGKLS